MSYSYFYWKKYDCNWVTKLRSRYYCNMTRIRPRLIRCHRSFDPRWVKISGHSEQLGPCGSTSHFVNNRHSKVKTRGASCIGGFGQTDGRRKFELGIPQSRGASYIRGTSYIRDKTVRLICTNPLIWFLQNHVYSPCPERPPVLRNCIIQWSIYITGSAACNIPVQTNLSYSQIFFDKFKLFPNVLC